MLLLNLEATGRLQEHIQHDFERQHLSCRNLPTLLRIVEVEKGQLSLSYFRVRGGAAHPPARGWSAPAPLPTTGSLPPGNPS